MATTWTKKHYEALASEINTLYRQTTVFQPVQHAENMRVLKSLVANLEIRFKFDNPAFDSNRFETACWTLKSK